MVSRMRDSMPERRCVQCEPVLKPTSLNGLNTVALVAMPPTTPGGPEVIASAQPASTRPVLGTLLLMMVQVPVAAHGPLAEPRRSIFMRFASLAFESRS